MAKDVLQLVSGLVKLAADSDSEEARSAGHRACKLILRNNLHVTRSQWPEFDSIEEVFDYIEKRYAHLINPQPTPAPEPTYTQAPGYHPPSQQRKKKEDMAKQNKTEETKTYISDEMLEQAVRDHERAGYTLDQHASKNSRDGAVVLVRESTGQTVYCKRDEENRETSHS